MLVWVNTKYMYISSLELKTSEFSTHSMKYFWYTPQKSKYPLFTYPFHSDGSSNTYCYNYYGIVHFVVCMQVSRKTPRM